VPQDHFLRHLRALVDWDALTESLADCYKGGAEYGRVPYHPAVPFKMLLLAYLYNLSERQVEQFANENLPARYFLGLGAHQVAPDHSSLTVFRERILAKIGTEAFEKLFQEVVRTAQEAGIVLGHIQVVDATHSLADVDVNRDRERQADGIEPRDGDAAWGTKGKRRVKTADGGTALVNKSFYGYKTHLSVNAESGLITGVAATPGNETDGKQLGKLLARDEAAGVRAQVYAGDRGYDDGENHELLRVKGKQSALCLNDYRTQKKDRNKGLWLQMKASQVYWQGQRQRYKVEQKNADAKRYHGLGRCRYLGLAKYAVQALLTAMAVNLKRMVWLLCGVRLRGTPAVVAAVAARA
jgi:IS5 family transposase